MVGRVARRRNQRDPADDLLLAIDEVVPAGLGDRDEVVIEVAGRRAFVGMGSIVVLTLLDDISGLRKRELHLPRRALAGIAAGVVEMQMRVDHQRDVRRRMTEFREAILEPRQSGLATVFDAVNVVELVVLLVAGTVVDEDEAGVVLDQEAAHAELNPVPRVGRNAPLPERLRDDAEHRSTVELLPSGLNRVDSKGADLPAFDEGLEGHAVCSMSARRGIAEGLTRFFRGARRYDRRSSIVARSRSRAAPSSRRSTLAGAVASAAARWRAVIVMPKKSAM